MISRLLRRLYDWVVGWANSPYATWALFTVAVAESSFFPIPPDVLLIALSVGAPRRALWFAAVATVGSLLGAGIGYWIGMSFYEWLGRPIVAFYDLQAQFDHAQRLYRDWDAAAVFVAGFTPIPFKVFTIAAGVFGLEIPTFLAASLLSRGARFFIVAGLIFRFGPAIQAFIERHLGWLTILFAGLLIGGFLIVKYAIN